MVVVTIGVSLTPNLTVTEFNNTATPLGTDAHTLSQICVDQRGLCRQPATGGVAGGGAHRQDQRGQPGVASDQPARDQRAELYEDRGGPGVTNLGLTDTNGNYIYLTFTDNAILAPQLIKFAPPPFGQLPTNENVLVSSFETVSAGDYGQSNALLPGDSGNECGSLDGGEQRCGGGDGERPLPGLRRDELSGAGQRR